jgi:hypothetical protein
VDLPRLRARQAARDDLGQLQRRGDRRLGPGATIARAMRREARSSP